MIQDFLQPAAGPEALARNLYEAHGTAIERWVNSRFSDRQVAEEVVQETILAAWRKHDQFDESRGSERAWVFGIARNAAASKYRRNRRHLQSVPSADRLDTVADDTEMARVTERSLIVDAMKSLSADHQAVVSAAYWEGLSTKEIAAKLGIADGTVKSRLHYALKILRTQLQEREVIQ